MASFLEELALLPNGWYLGFGRWVFRPRFFLQDTQMSYNPPCRRGLGGRIFRTSDGRRMCRPLSVTDAFVAHRVKGTARRVESPFGDLSTLSELRAAGLVYISRRQKTQRPGDVILGIDESGRLTRSEV